MKYLLLSTFILLIPSWLEACMKGCSSCPALSRCENCEIGYFLNPENACRKCPPGCLSCQYSLKTKQVYCTTCTLDRLLNRQGSCVPCDPECFSCAVSPNFCISCSKGRALEVTLSGKSECVEKSRCQPKCEFCFEYRPRDFLCLRCTSGNYLNNGNCQPCKATCDRCDMTLPQTILQEVKATLANQISNQIFIKDAQNRGKSLKKPPNYRLKEKNGESTEESESIDEEESQDESEDEENQDIKDSDFRKREIDAIFNKYAAQLDDGAFKLVDPNVLKKLGLSKITIEGKAVDTQPVLLTAATTLDALVDDLVNLAAGSVFSSAAQSVCRQCQEAFFPDNSNLCIPCLLNCKVCNQEGCVECFTGFSRQKRQGKWDCRPCQAPCRTCEEIEDLCLTCLEPYQLVESQCIKCKPPCRTCDIENPDSCISCESGYSQRANSKGICYKCKVSHCIACTEGTPEMCSQCQEGYISLAKVRACQKCPAGCLSCSNDANGDLSCGECLQGYTIMGRQCLACQSHCSQCSPRDLTQCLSCDIGFYVNKKTGSCVACPKTCLVCLSESVCLQESQIKVDTSALFNIADATAAGKNGGTVTIAIITLVGFACLFMLGKCCCQNFQKSSKTDPDSNAQKQQGEAKTVPQSSERNGVQLSYASEMRGI